MVTRRLIYLVVAYVALGLVSCQDGQQEAQADAVEYQEIMPAAVGGGYQEIMPFEGGAMPYDVDYTPPEEEMVTPAMPEEEPMVILGYPMEMPPMPEDPPMYDEGPTTIAPTTETLTWNDESSTTPDATIEEDIIIYDDATPVETEAPVENEAPETPAPESPGKKKKPKKPKTTLAPDIAHCNALLEAEKLDCFSTIPEGYVAKDCSFTIKNADCDWVFFCTHDYTEAPTDPPPPPEESSESDENAESCETDKKIKFKNCFINIKGFVKKK